MLTRQLYALAGAQEAAVGEQGFRWQRAVPQQRARAIKVAQYQVEQFGSLQQARLDPGPVLAANDVGHRVQFPGVARTVFLSVEVIGGAIIPQDALDLLLPLCQQAGAEILQAVEQVAPLRFDTAVGGKGIVHFAGGHLVGWQRGHTGLALVLALAQDW